MDLKVTGKCFIQQESGLVVDASGNRLHTKSALFCRITPFIITKDDDIDNFAGGRVHGIYQVDDHYFDFFKEQVKELQVKKVKV